jgi:transposase
MRIIGVDLHARQQSVAMLDTDTGEVIEKTLQHESDEVRELPSPVLVGIEATGSMPWFLKLMKELKIECRVGHPADIRAAEPRKQKHDRRDARLLLNLLAENRFPAIWMPSTEQRDLRTLLRHRHQFVRKIDPTGVPDCVNGWGVRERQKIRNKNLLTRPASLEIYRMRVLGEECTGARSS